MNGLSTERGSSSGNLYSASVFVGAESFLGPACLGVGWGGGGNVSAYFLLGGRW